MFLKLRILFTILSTICLAAIIPIGTLWDFTPAIISAAIGGVFFLLMIVCKNKQERQENPPAPQSKADFFNPANNTDEADKQN